jgi:leader peptidase (prepilin peptidase)/N-methyltransferase
MNLYKMIIFGIIGLIIGYKITDISNKIINYKRLETDIDENNFLNSKIMLVLITVITVVLWALSGSINNTIIGLLISAQITIGIIIAYIDVKIRIIPNELVLAMIIVGILFQAINFGLLALIGAVISMIVMMVVFTSVASFVGFGKVGAGDVKLAGAMGLSLGYPLIITALGVMAVALLIFILTGMVLKKIYLSTMLPFAPFMIIGYITAYVPLLI